MKFVDHTRGRFIGSRMATLLITSALGVLIAAEASAQWTQYGGPDQNFRADSTGLAKEWPPDGPPKLWSRMLGAGYSAILADGDRLYTMYRAKERERAICLDAKTGQTVWEHTYKSSPGEGHVSEYGKGSNATPRLADGRLYTIGVAGVMHCLAADTGKVRWSHNLWREFRGGLPEFGYSSSPIEYEDTVIALVGGQRQSIVAFNKKDGSVAWKDLDFVNSYSTPRILRIGGEDQLVTFMAGEVIGADPRSGQLKWRYANRNRWGQNICMPMLADDTLFISSLEVGSRASSSSRTAESPTLRRSGPRPRFSSST